MSTIINHIFAYCAVDPVTHKKGVYRQDHTLVCTMPDWLHDLLCKEGGDALNIFAVYMSRLSEGQNTWGKIEGREEAKAEMRKALGLEGVKTC